MKIISISQILGGSQTSRTPLVTHKKRSLLLSPNISIKWGFSVCAHFARFVPSPPKQNRGVTMKPVK